MELKEKEHVVFPEPRRLAFGVYKATAMFRRIKEHSGVCYADNWGIVATTGPAGDELSQKYAELFAASPDLLAALQVLLDQVDYTAGACAVTEMVGAVLPKEVIARAREAIAKARGLT